MPKFTQKKEPVVAKPINNLERASQYSRKEMLINSFLGGMMWGIGSIVGISLLVAVVGLITQYVNVVPIIGDFVLDILQYIQLKGN